MVNAPHVNSYYAATARDSLGFARLEQELEADVAIIGGGFTGISTGIELAERGLDVVVLEANKVGWGATGRNGGQVTGSLSGEGSMHRLFASSLGQQEAKDYVWNLKWRGHSIIERRAEKYGIDCDLRYGHIQTAIAPKHLRELEAVYSEAKRRGMADQCTLLDEVQVKQYIGSDLYIGGLLNKRNMHLHSLDLCVGEARALESIGGRVFESSGVLKIEHGALARVITLAGCVKARTVIVAGNAFHTLEAKATQGALFPASLSNMATEVLPKGLVDELNPHNMAVYDSRFVLDYFRMTADNRLMFGSGTNYSGQQDKDIVAALRPAMLRVFPQLESVAIEYAWAGIDGIIANRIPQVGYIQPNVLFAQGYSGHGIALTHIMGEILAKAVTGDTQEFDLFESVPHIKLPYARTFGSQIQAAGMAFYKLKDALF